MICCSVSTAMIFKFGEYFKIICRFDSYRLTGEFLSLCNLKTLSKAMYVLFPAGTT
jgi:hypothetical protein